MQRVCLTGIPLLLLLGCEAKQDHSFVSVGDQSPRPEAPASVHGVTVSRTHQSSACLMQLYRWRLLRVHRMSASTHR